ncbi:hypothetical protein BOSEA31B_14085 [Hyphomicrobiales bacterium]|nr:hypothetical protein BOSEA31B_14085 [Hyphomicrobiales bacterium]
MTDVVADRRTEPVLRDESSERRSEFRASLPKRPTDELLLRRSKIGPWHQLGKYRGPNLGLLIIDNGKRQEPGLNHIEVCFGPS